jgi:flagellar biosynthetic protein FliP
VADTSTAALVLRLVLSLGIVLALVGAVTWALRRKGLLRTGPVGGRGGRLEVLDRRPLNRHASIVLARVGGTAVLLGVTEQRIEVLSTAEGLDAAWRELPEADATPAPWPGNPPAGVPRGPLGDDTSGTDELRRGAAGTDRPSFLIAREAPSRSPLLRTERRSIPVWLLILLFLVAFVGPAASTAGAQPSPSDPQDPTATTPAPPTPPSIEDVTNPTTPPPIGTSTDDGDDLVSTEDLRIDVDLDGEDGQDGPSRTVAIILGLTVLAVAPAILIMMTSFTRIVVVLSLVRNALGLQGIPPNQVLVGLSLFLTVFVMGPVLTEVNDVALQPYLDGEISQSQALDRAEDPIKEFMLANTRESQLSLMLDLQGAEKPEEPMDTSLVTLVPAFVLSELQSAFIIGLVLFVPFVILDLVVSAVLMSLGMMMLPPVFVSLPLKLLLFVMVDGWGLTVTSVVTNYKGVSTG